MQNLFCRVYINNIRLKIVRQIVGIPTDTNYAPLIEDLFLFCYERDFMLPLSENNETNVTESLTLPLDI